MKKTNLCKRGLKKARLMKDLNKKLIYNRR